MRASLRSIPSGLALIATLATAFACVGPDGLPRRPTAPDGDDSTTVPDSLQPRPGAPRRLEFRDVPSPNAGEVLRAIEVLIVDSAWQRIEANDSITLRLLSADTAARLLGTTRVAAHEGLATFTDLRIERAGTGYRLMATAANYIPDTSYTFPVMPAAPAQLTFIVPPSDVPAGWPITPAVEVELRDAYGNLTTNYSDTVSAQLEANPGGATLTGTLRVKAAAGKATFANLSLDKGGSGYTLTFRAVAASRTSAAITVRQPPVIESGGVTVAMNGRHSCALDAGGAAYCWGINVSGDLGDGRMLESAVPLPVGGGYTFDSLTVGSGYACATTADRRAFCWGNNSLGMLGDGTWLHRSLPVPVSGGLRVGSVTAGYSTTCALTDQGMPWCWGYDHWPHDDPSARQRSPFTQVPEPRQTDPLTGLSMLGLWICGVSGSGTIWCWDDDGNMDAVYRDTAITDVVLSPHANCALKRDGRLACWEADSGALYYAGSPTDVETPLRFRSLFKGTGMLCAMGTDGRIRCWKGSPFTTPAHEVDFAAISSDRDHTCGLTPAGEAWCWGANARGQLGDGTYDSSATPVRVLGGQTFRTIVAKSQNTCALTTGGQAYCWGANSGGILGDGAPVWRDAPVRVATSQRFASVTAGYGHACGLTSDGTGWCWGSNDYGQLGNGTRRDASAPVRLATQFRMLGAGGDQTCGLTAAGDAWCWGSTGWYGNGGLEFSTSPVRIAGAPAFAAIAVGASHACGLTVGGAAWCWGVRSMGAGNYAPRPPDRYTAVAVRGNRVYRAISAGDMHTCALEANGAAWCWGYDGTDDDGSGEPPPFDALSMPLSGSEKMEPVRVPGTHAFQSLSVGAVATCGIATDGRAWCWGKNLDGRLGVPSSLRNTPNPVEVGGNLRFRRIASGGTFLDGHTCGITESGAAWCWGGNFYGQLGIGGINRSETPARVGGTALFATRAP